MESSEQLEIEAKLRSLEKALSGRLRILLISAALILIALFVLLYINVNDFLSSGAAESEVAVAQTSINQLTAQQQATTEMNEDLATQLQEEQELASASQLTLNNTQSQLDDTRARLTESQAQLAENQRLLNESQTQLEQARQDTQQASSAEAELARVQLELAELQEQGAARQQQYQQEIENNQRELRDSLDQQNQLANEIASLREVINANESRAVSTAAAEPVREREVVPPIEVPEVETPEAELPQQNAIREIATPAAAAPAVVAPVPDVIVDEELLSRVSPVYPRRAASRNIEGSCEVEFTVSTNGEVIDPVVVGSDPGGVFDDACLDAIVDFEYRPRTINGVPVDTSGVRMSFRFEFN